MNFEIKSPDGDILFAGTKQDCMHYIKRQALQRGEFQLVTQDNKPAVHYTVPVTEDAPPPKGFFKRIYDRL